jgi:hypothetical protein
VVVDVELEGNKVGWLGKDLRICTCAVATAIKLDDNKTLEASWA